MTNIFPVLSCTVSFITALPARVLEPCQHVAQEPACFFGQSLELAEEGKANTEQHSEGAISAWSDSNAALHTQAVGCNSHFWHSRGSVGRTAAVLCVRGTLRNEAV